MTAVLTLVEREMTRFFRQPNRLAGAIGQPLIFWLLFGAAFDASFRSPGRNETYAQFFLPGVAVLIVLFTAIFSTISIIEDRREGFLQGVLVAPVPRATVVMGKILGGTLLSVLQGALFLLLGPLVGVPLAPATILGAVGILGLVGFGLTGLGFSIAWRMDSAQGFHAIMSVFLMPMWLLSGAFFPAQGLAPWLAWMLRLNPLTYGVAALRETLAPGASGHALPVSVGISALFAAAMLVLAMRLAHRPARGDLIR